MLDDIMVTSVSILAISFFIARAARVKNAADNITNFLFGGNDVVLATSSNIGSMLSIALIFAFYISIVIGYGFWAFIALSVGIIFGYGVLYIGIIRLLNKNGNNDSYLNKTMIEPLLDQAPKNKSIFSNIFQFQYFVFLVLEFVIFLYATRSIFPESIYLPYVITIGITFLCGCYTSIGGYSGVLRTDLFQMMLFLGGIIYLFIDILPEYRVLFLKHLSVSGIKNNFIDVPLLGFISVVFATASFFCSFPDVWVRNWSSLKRDSKKNLKLMYIVCILTMLIAMSFILIAALPIIDYKDNFTMKLETTTAINYYLDVFRNSDLIQNSNYMIFILGSIFICVYITTVDTWLIGIMQHQNINEKTSFLRISVIPFKVLLLVIIVGVFLNWKGYTCFGLISMPFFILNFIIYSSEVFFQCNAYKNPSLIMSTLFFGIIITALLSIVYWSDLDNNGVHIWTIVFIAMLSYFAIIPHLSESIQSKIVSMISILTFRK